MHSFTSAATPARISPAAIDLPPTQPIQIIGWLGDDDFAPSLAGSTAW